ncbi:helix-turn-helix domain-containing protein [Ornithinibacillus sp. 4-3]|uniref:Helix-turn-helix domain-containing protein n=1 Tax=Ornithinibacillus sp. 4-3 TaxID=3231488 RepID=A0AB39HV16_9BACI
MDEDIIKIRSELFKRGMEHRELAKLLGISGAYLSDILNGKRTGKKAQEHIKHACKILGL